MATDIRKAHRQLLEEAFGKGRMEAFDEVCDRGAHSHDPLTGDADLDQAKQNCVMYRSAFPGLRCTILAQVAEGDTVVTHWRMSGVHEGTLMGIAPTGATCTVEGISFGKFRAGKLVDDWIQWDALGLMRQLGVTLQAGTRKTEARPSP